MFDNPEIINFQAPNQGDIEADFYRGPGNTALILAHGKAFDKDSWQEEARRWSSGLSVLALNFRGYGDSTGPGGLDDQDMLQAIPVFALDILGAADYLVREMGMERVLLLGASMGGGAAAEAASLRPERFASLILLSPVPIDGPERIKAGHIHYLFSREEPLAPRIAAQYEKTAGRKTVEVFDGAAHAQHLLKSPHRERLTALIESYLSGETAPVAA